MVAKAACGQKEGKERVISQARNVKDYNARFLNEQ
jgi:hypothetical protein